MSLAFPGGDVAPERGVCTDVVIRALRQAHGIDLRLAVNRDIKADFSACPARWGLTRSDANIDQRRVPNLESLLTRIGARTDPRTGPARFEPGDIVTARRWSPIISARVKDALFDHPLRRCCAWRPTRWRGCARWEADAQ